MNNGTNPPHQGPGVRLNPFNGPSQPIISPPSVNIQPTYTQGSGFGANIQFGFKF